MATLIPSILILLSFFVSLYFRAIIPTFINDDWFQLQKKPFSAGLSILPHISKFFPFLSKVKIFIFYRFNLLNIFGGAKFSASIVTRIFLSNSFAQQRNAW
ncbi:MAG: hypothetical protein R3310_03325 [Candidatus Competibacteraceae bacterium]|nr:hypothetical protein [Candidatus Competibacteraceae bacterium]